MSDDFHIPMIGDRFERVVIMTDKNFQTKEWKKPCRLTAFKKKAYKNHPGETTMYITADSFEDCDMLVFQPETNENIPFWQDKEDYPVTVNMDPPKANTFLYVIYKLIS